MRLDIRSVTRFRYEQPVRESSNELRACPVTDHRQQLVSYRVETTPPSRVHSSVYYWGTRVDAFGIRPPHTELEVVAESVVETRPAPLLAASPRLSAVHEPAFQEQHREYLERTAHTDWGERVASEPARRAETVGDDLLSVVLALHRTVGTSLRYTPGSTYVGVGVEEVLRSEEGVGHGRDYDDVPPLKGAFSGPPAHDLDVGVHMRKLAQVVQQQ